MKIESERVTYEEYPALKRELDAALAAGDATLDFASVHHVDSTAVALVLHASRACAQAGVTLRCLNFPEAYHELVALYGLNELLASQG